MKKRTLRSNQETDEGKRCAALGNSLTKKAPYKGLGAESEEKREPVSDIDTGVVDSLKVLDPDDRLEKRPTPCATSNCREVSTTDIHRWRWQAGHASPALSHASKKLRRSKRLSHRFGQSTP